MVEKEKEKVSKLNIVLFLLIAILNIIAWVLLASAGVMIARYFDSVWPEYERRVVVDGSGVVTGEKIQRRRRISYFTVIYFLFLNLIF
jgi:predicted nucleic acid-binding Zn ribbon protein